MKKIILSLILISGICSSGLSATNLQGLFDAVSIILKSSTIHRYVYEDSLYLLGHHIQDFLKNIERKRTFRYFHDALLTEEEGKKQCKIENVDNALKYLAQLKDSLCSLFQYNTPSSRLGASIEQVSNRVFHMIMPVLDSLGTKLNHYKENIRTYHEPGSTEFRPSLDKIIELFKVAKFANKMINKQNNVDIDEIEITKIQQDLLNLKNNIANKDHLIVKIVQLYSNLNSELEIFVVKPILEEVVENLALFH